MKRQIHTIVGIGNAIGFLLAFCLMIGPCSLSAGTLSEMDVRSAVQTWVRSVTADARPDAFIERMEPYQVEGEIMAYVAHLAGGGYCICGANESVLPVYLYCPKGVYDQKNPACLYILQSIGSRTKFVREGLQKGDARVLAQQSRLLERATYWGELVSTSVSRKPTRVESALAEPDSMSLPLTCHWGQGSPYNDQCPELTPGIDERTYVGCVATALSQIMYYWKWPTTGAGSHTDANNYDYRWRTDWDEEPLPTDPNISSGLGNNLEWTSASGGRLRMTGYWDASLFSTAQKYSTSTGYQQALQTLYDRLTSGSTSNSANFGATTYQWSLMQDVHEDPSDAGDNAVATLCYHVAVAVDMTFGLFASSSYLSLTRDPLVNYFRYDGDAAYVPYDQGDISSLIAENILWLRPVALRTPFSSLMKSWAASQSRGNSARLAFRHHVSPVRESTTTSVII